MTVITPAKPSAMTAMTSAVHPEPTGLIFSGGPENMAVGSSACVAVDEYQSVAVGNRVGDKVGGGDVGVYAGRMISLWSG